MAMFALVLGGIGLSGGATTAETSATIDFMGNVRNTGYHATIHKGGFFGSFIDDESNPYVILREFDEITRYVDEIMTTFRRDTAIVPDGYWESIEQNVREFHARYDEDFFKQNILVIAIVDRGSGNVSYDVENVRLDTEGIVTVDVNKKAPMIQTMDFVHWVLFLELDRAVYNDVTSINIELS